LFAHCFDVFIIVYPSITILLELISSKKL